MYTFIGKNLCNAKFWQILLHVSFFNAFIYTVVENICLRYTSPSRQPSQAIDEVNSDFGLEKYFPGARRNAELYPRICKFLSATWIMIFLNQIIELLVNVRVYLLVMLRQALRAVACSILLGLLERGR